jgi:virulence factor Mce-like protein
MNRRQSSLAASPLLIGAVTTLITVVAVYLSYNAGQGLPFVPTYNIKAELPSGANLVKGNDVRIGGSRVGVVEGIVPKQNPKTGKVVAIVSMKLEKSIDPLPVDTQTVVASRSDIGLKYMELIRGKSKEGIKSGGTIPLSHSSEPVEIDQFFDMFDEKTRTASQHNLVTFGDGFAGRGLGLNETIHELRPLVDNATPVLRNLADPKTGFGELFKALDRVAKESAPVAQQQANFYSDLDTFFKAWAGVAPSLEKTIEGGPAALQQATHSLRYEASFVEKSTEFMHLLRPAASALRTAAPAFGKAIEAGATDFREAAALNTRVASFLTTLKSFSEDPVVAIGLNSLTETAQIATPLFSGLASEQSTCNYVTLTFRNLVSLLSQDIGVGTLARATIVLAPNGPNNEGFPSSSPANGPSIDHGAEEGGKPGPLIDDNHLHVNPYPNVAGLGQPKECEAGNEKYEAGKAVIGHTAGPASTVHNETKRSEDRYGNPYPEATLTDLGLNSKGEPLDPAKEKAEAEAKKKAEAEKKAKAKAKAKKKAKGKKK